MRASLANAPEPTSRVRVSAAVLAALAAAALAGCGSSSPSADTTGGSSGSPTAPSSVTAPSYTQPGSGTAPAATSTSGVTTVTGPTTTTSTSASGGATASAPACTATVLTASFLGMQGATGHGELGFALKNVGTSTCHTYGYPGVQFIDGAGRPLPTSSRRTTEDLFGSTALTSIDLKPGESASFRLAVSHVSSSGCATAAALSVIPPNDTHSLLVRIPGGASECGSTDVSPMRPGVSAYP